jgi:hypothetical protein
LATSDTHRWFRLSPFDRMLTEIDGPFTRTGNRPSQPSDIDPLAFAERVVEREFGTIDREPVEQVLPTIVATFERVAGHDC